MEGEKAHSQARSMRAYLSLMLASFRTALRAEASEDSVGANGWSASRLHRTLQCYNQPPAHPTYSPLPPTPAPAHRRFFCWAVSSRVSGSGWPLALSSPSNTEGGQGRVGQGRWVG